jgi:hypothetical protein
VKHFFILSLLLLPACTQYQTRVFEISVKNETVRPISVGLVKNGAPNEEGWIAPHQVAMMAPQLTDRKWGLVIEPGQTKVIGPHNGKFEQGVQAILRIYAGTPTIEEMLSYSRSDPERLDIYLWPGKSGYVIRYDGGRISFVATEDSK